MVILLAVYPLAVAAGIFLLDRLIPVGIVAFVTSTPTFAAILSAVVLAATIVAALRQREKVVLLSAWLFFFCGEAILALGVIMEPFVPPGVHWIEEVFETVSLFPLLLFVAYVASPVRIMIIRRSRLRLYPLVGALLLAGAAAVAFIPWVLGLEGARQYSTPENALHLSQTVLDVILLEPIAVVLLVIGISRSSLPYVFVAIGLALLLPEDLLAGYVFLRGRGLLAQYAHLVFIASQIYILNGALLAGFRRMERPEAAEEAESANQPTLR